MILSFLKRERERTVNVPWTHRERDFAIVSDRLSCTVWSFHTVHRPWPSTVPDRYHDRFWPFLTVSKTLINAQKRPGTVRNGQEWSGTVIVTVRNGQERWTVRDGERYETIILYKINGQKRLQNHVHGAFTVRSRLRFKNERITVLFLYFLTIKFF